MKQLVLVIPKASVLVKSEVKDNDQKSEFCLHLYQIHGIDCQALSK